MIGLGILELALITGAGYYILSHFSRKRKVQYIEINQQQFDQLQDTLIVNNILPVNMNSNNFYDRLQQIPPTYQESEDVLPPVPPYQSTGPPQLYLNNNAPAILETTTIISPPPDFSSQNEEETENQIGVENQIGIETTTIQQPQHGNSIMSHSI